MNASLRSLIAVFAAYPLFSYSPARADAPRKCAAVIGPPVYVVDGRIVAAPGRPSDLTTIESIAVVCSDESHRVFGIEPGRDLVLTWTKVVPSATLQSSLESLAALQTPYHAAHGRFARTLEDLSWSDPSRAVAVRLCVSEDGHRWVALGWNNSPDANPKRVLVSGHVSSSTEVAPRYTCQL